MLPTLEACVELQYGYNFCNDALFEGKLPQCILTYTRRKNCLGYFSPDRFERSNGEVLAELALNAEYLKLRDDRESLSTLVHEQVHVWRHYLADGDGGATRRPSSYHDRVWADRMELVGLMPSATGKPGGKRTGHRMTHYIIEGGPFDLACRELLSAGFRINWHGRVELRTTGFSGGGTSPDPDPQQPGKRDRVKFTCPCCKLNAWAKSTAGLTCTACSVPMHAGHHTPANMPVPVNSRR